jgi:hypothetical protein
MVRIRNLIGVVCLSCGSTSVKTTEESSAITEEQRSNPALPASAAGTSTEAGPGVPDDFAGTIGESMPLTQEELEGLAAADALSRARNPPGTKPTDRGFGEKLAPASVAPTARGEGGTP